MICNK